MASKFSEFLSTHKIDPRRIAISSRKLESLRVEDRAAKLKKRQAKGTDPAPAVEGAVPDAKRRSGRPVTPRLMSSALEGKPVTGPAKTRLLRAVNRILEQKKQEPVALKALF